MEIRRIKNELEIEKCIDLYITLNDESFIPANREKSIKSLKSSLTSNEFFRILEDNGEIVAWILAIRFSHPHVYGLVYQQQFYASTLTGIKAVKAVRLLHEALIEEAIRMNISRVISTGSHLDDNNTFVKILEKAGWSRRNYVATLDLKPRILKRRACVDVPKI